mmetsp:Transcript_75935/g.210834  ORF Transcript_75935/g.210834 Transcript_75935/m.210834 type:complete len:320 (+) Transcript_75935:52-1011(+)
MPRWRRPRVLRAVGRRQCKFAGAVSVAVAAFAFAFGAALQWPPPPAAAGASLLGVGTALCGAASKFSPAASSSHSSASGAVWACAGPRGRPSFASTVLAAVPAKKAKIARRPKRPASRGFAPVSPFDEPPKDYDTEPKVLDIKRYPHPLLRKKSKEVNEFGPQLGQLADNLFSTMYSSDDGVGLAAPQCGVNLRLMVFNSLRTLDSQNREGDTVFVNPRIASRSKERVEMWESCLSLPKIEAPVTRPVWVEIEAMDLEGKPFTRRLENLDARVFLHEYDHLEGKLFVDRVQEEHLEDIQQDLEDLRGQYIAAGGQNPKS